MASGFSATVVGDDRVAAMLRAARNAMDGEPMELALVAGALLIQNAAKANAPYLTGTLRRSIHIGGHTDKSADFQGDDIGGNSARQVVVGTNVPYGRRIEYGFSGRDSLGRLYNQAARPYLRPAVAEQQAAATREVVLALRDILKAQLGGAMS